MLLLVPSDVCAEPLLKCITMATTSQTYYFPKNNLSATVQLFYQVDDSMLLSLANVEFHSIHINRADMC